MITGQDNLCSCGSGIRYEDCCAKKQKAATHGATLGGIMDEIRTLLEGRSFASLEEANAFLSLHMQQRNQAPKEDFDGLSSEQMYRFLHFPFESPFLVSFQSCLSVAPEAPIITLFRLLTEAFEDKGLKATATGNLPRNLCREIALEYFGEEKYLEIYRYGELRSEPEFFDLHVTRLVSGLSGFVRKYKGKFILTGEYRKVMTKHGLAGIFQRLFREFAGRYNWSYRGGLREIPLIQQSFLFSLYLLKKYGTDWRANRFYEDGFLRAFPAVLEEVSPIGDYYSPEQILRGCYSQLCLEGFAAFVGLAEIQHDSAGGPNVGFSLRKLPLLDHVVRFHM